MLLKFDITFIFQNLPYSDSKPNTIVAQTYQKSYLFYSCLCLSTKLSLSVDATCPFETSSYISLLLAYTGFYAIFDTRGTSDTSDYVVGNSDSLGVYRCTFKVALAAWLCTSSVPSAKFVFASLNSLAFLVFLLMKFTGTTSISL